MKNLHPACLVILLIAMMTACNTQPIEPIEATPRQVASVTAPMADCPLEHTVQYVGNARYSYYCDVAGNTYVSRTEADTVHIGSIAVEISKFESTSSGNPGEWHVFHMTDTETGITLMPNYDVPIEGKQAGDTLYVFVSGGNDEERIFVPYLLGEQRILAPNDPPAWLIAGEVSANRILSAVTNENLQGHLPALRSPISLR